MMMIINSIYIQKFPESNPGRFFGPGGFTDDAPYLKNQITRNRRLNEHERPDLLDHIAPNQNRTSQNLTNGPTEIRPQIVSNNITPIDPLEISEQSNEKRKSLLTLNQIFPQEIRNKVQTVRLIKNAPTQHHQRSLLQILTYHTTPCQ